MHTLSYPRRCHTLHLHRFPPGMWSRRVWGQWWGSNVYRRMRCGKNTWISDFGFPISDLNWQLQIADLGIRNYHHDPCRPWFLPLRSLRLCGGFPSHYVLVGCALLHPTYLFAVSQTFLLFQPSSRLLFDTRTAFSGWFFVGCVPTHPRPLFLEGSKELHPTRVKWSPNLHFRLPLCPLCLHTQTWPVTSRRRAWRWCHTLTGGYCRRILCQYLYRCLCKRLRCR